MRIRVIAVSQSDKSRNPLVNFISSIGSGWGEWNGNISLALDEYEVELEIQDTLAWDVTIAEVETDKAAIFYDNDVLIIQGQLESVASDGVVFVRLDTALIMLETVGPPPAPGVFVEIRPSKIILFPHDRYDLESSATRYYDHAGNQTIAPKRSVRDKISLNFSASQHEDVFDFKAYKEALEQVGLFRQKIDDIWEILSTRPESERDQIPEWAQYGTLIEQFQFLTGEFRRRLPVQILAQCPYCRTVILQPFDSFSLVGFYEDFQLAKIYAGGREWHASTWPQNRCRHALFTIPFVNLNDLQPDDVPAWILKSGSLRIGPQPFDSSPYMVVWPLIAKETCAVIHSLPIGRLDDSQPVPRYTAYFVTYFADDTSNVHSMWESGGLESGYMIPATDGVFIDLDLLKWVKVRRLFWLNPENPEQLVQESLEMFPYANVQPTGWYRILGGGQIDGPHPYDSAYVWQGEAPAHKVSHPQSVD